MKPEYHGSTDVAETGARRDQAPCPDVLLVGDSHVLALHQGCEAHGIRSTMLKSGGIHWNEGKIRVFGPRRARSPFLPALGPSVRNLETQLGLGDIFDNGIPVIASIGFHCGHLARAFGAEGHVAWPPPDALPKEDPGDTLFASRSLLDAFVEERRARHFALLRYINGKCRLTVILPPRAPKNAPKFRFRHNIDALTACIARKIDDMGIDIYDPNTEFVGPDELLPWEWVNEDGFHGTPEYGARAVERLLSRGALRP
ncbi:hypothetical protein DQW77_09520 [Roseovarius sp. TE539]|uniref:hypothetical protein n=1 Tax=Roseovarius sp. TE539 TaxID=2249812 RepID=UPI000DDE9032|nr:hypothetical protein [Roseovarius sp. TE539]RBI73083.1 hypothetical protein DQW77_09520 [Roseovarius sp. TE539]